MSRHRPIIACYRVSDLPKPYAPSTALVCHRCHEPVWLSDMTVRAVKENEGSMEAVDVHCLQCMKPEMEGLKKGEAKIGPLSNEQLTDLEERVGHPLSKQRLEAYAKEHMRDLVPREKK